MLYRPRATRVFDERTFLITPVPQSGLVLLPIMCFKSTCSFHKAPTSSLSLLTSHSSTQLLFLIAIRSIVEVSIDDIASKNFLPTSCDFHGQTELMSFILIQLFATTSHLSVTEQTPCIHDDTYLAYKLLTPSTTSLTASLRPFQSTIANLLQNKRVLGFFRLGRYH